MKIVVVTCSPICRFVLTHESVLTHELVFLGCDLGCKYYRRESIKGSGAAVEASWRSMFNGLFSGDHSKSLTFGLDQPKGQCRRTRGIRDGFGRANRVADTARSAFRAGEIRRFSREPEEFSRENRRVFPGESQSRNTSEFNVIGPVLQSIHSIQQRSGAQRRGLSTTRRAMVTMAPPASELRGV